MSTKPKLIAEQTIPWYSTETPPEAWREILVRKPDGLIVGAFVDREGEIRRSSHGGRLTASAWTYAFAPEIPEEELEAVEEEDCTDCCQHLAVYDFAPAPSRHQRAAEVLQEEWERGEEER